MLRLITFGGLRIENGTVVNGAANPRSRLAILAVIAAGGEGGVRREKLTAMFWPDSDDERARNALRQALFVLKRDVGGVSLTEGVTHLQLSSATISSDLGEFERAIADQRWDAAVSVYSGPFLDGVLVRELPEFERWADEQRQRLSNAFGRALEGLAERASASGDLTAAAAWWDRRSQHDPFSARVAVGFMEALAASGERERAIHHASTYAERLRTELEVEPESQVLALATALRTSRRSVPSGSSVPDVDLTHRAADVPGARLVADAGAPAFARARSAWRRWQSVAAAIVLALAASLWWIDPLAGGPPRVRVDLATTPGDSLLGKLGDAARGEVERHLTADGHVQVLGDTLHAASRTADWIVSTRLDSHRDSIVANTRVIDRETGVTLAQLEPLSVHHAASVALLARVRDGVRGALAALTDTLYAPWAGARSRPPSYPAFQSFMQGMDAVVNQGPTEAAAAFRRAMELDPDFVEAKIWYLEQADALNAPDIDSVVQAARAQRGRLSPFDQLALDRTDAFIHGRLEDTYTAARRLYALAPGIEDAQVYLLHAAMATRRYREALRVVHAMDLSRGWVATLHLQKRFDLAAHRLLGDVATGLREWRAMRAKEPVDVGICGEGISLLGAAGDESALYALASECQALAGAPTDSASMFETAGRFLRFGGHEAASRRALERALAMRRSNPASLRGQPLALGVLLAELGDWEGAYREIREKARPENPMHRMRLGVVAGHVGDTATAREALEFFDRRPGDRRGTSAADEARGFIHAALGNADTAIVYLRRARDRGHAPLFVGWYNRFELTSLRQDYRFRALIAPQ